MELELRERVLIKQLHSRAPDWLLLVAVLVVVLVAYWPALRNGFVWDDRVYLFDPEMMDAELWTEKLSRAFLLSRNYYRPVPLMTLIVQALGEGPDARLLHLANVLVHAFNTMLVGILCLRLGTRVAHSGRSGWIAALAALLYGLHPANIEVVAWISGRFDLLVTTFLLLTLLADTMIARTWVRATLVGICYFAAACSKEMAMAFPFVIFSWHMAWHPRPLRPLKGLVGSMVARGELQTYLAVVAGGLGYLAWRLIAMGYIYSPLPDRIVEAWPVRILLFFKSLAWYLLATVYPFNMISPVHPRPLHFSPSDPYAWAAVAGVLLVLALVVLAIRNRPRLGWLSAGSLCAFLPVLHLIPITIGDNYVHDRFMAFPLAMGAMVLSYALAASFRQTHVHDKALRWATVLVLGSFAAWSLLNVRVTVPLWESNVRIWNWAVQKHPESALARSNLANEYNSLGAHEKAFEEAKKAIGLNVGLARPWTVAGNALNATGKYQKAWDYQSNALKLAPNDPGVLCNAGNLLVALKRYQEAQAYLLKAHQISPYNRQCNMNLSLLYLAQGRYDQAREPLSRAFLGLSEGERAAFWRLARRKVGSETVAVMQSKLSTSTPSR